MPISNRRSNAKPAPTPYWQSECGRAVVYVGDCRDVMSQMIPETFHAVVTDPPYELASSTPSSMYHVRAAKKDGGGVPNTGNWDSTGVAFDLRTWGAALGVCRPGAHLLSFGGTRTFHRIACTIEDVGFELRDTLMWLYASGYPKGLDVGKAIDKELGALHLREVVGTRVAPDTTKVRAGFTGRAHSGNGVGSTREIEITIPATDAAKQWDGWNTTLKPAWEPVIVARKAMLGGVAQNVLINGCGGLNVGACRVGDDGLWPANIVHDGKDEVLCRYFYGAKANADDNNRPHGDGAALHPTVKPLDLMRWLVRLVCAKGGTVLDPFMGSGSTGCAALEEGMWFVGIEQSQEYADIAVGRLKLALAKCPSAVQLETGKKVDRAAVKPPQFERI